MKLDELKSQHPYVSFLFDLTLFITDSAIFKLFVELLVYLLGFFLFLLFTWLMVTQGTVWSFQ